MKVDDLPIRRCPRCYRPAVSYAGTPIDGARWCRRHGPIKTTIPGVVRRRLSPSLYAVIVANRRTLNFHNQQAEEFLGELLSGEQTGTPVDADGRPLPIATAKSYEVAYPIRGGYPPAFRQPFGFKDLAELFDQRLGDLE